MTAELTVRGAVALLTVTTASWAPKSRVPPETVTPAVLAERMAPEATVKVLPPWATVKAVPAPKRRALTERAEACVSAATRLMFCPAVRVAANSSVGLSGRRPPVAE